MLVLCGASANGGVPTLTNLLCLLVAINKFYLPDNVSIIIAVIIFYKLTVMNQQCKWLLTLKYFVTRLSE